MVFGLLREFVYINNFQFINRLILSTKVLFMSNYFIFLQDPTACIKDDQWPISKSKNDMIPIGTRSTYIFPLYGLLCWLYKVLHWVVFICGVCLSLKESCNGVHDVCSYACTAAAFHLLYFFHHWVEILFFLAMKVGVGPKLTELTIGIKVNILGFIF